MRIWKVRMTSYWLLSVAIYLIGLGIGDSSLVILSLCSFVISFFSSLYFLSVIFSLPYDFLHKIVFLNIYFYYLSKKKLVLKLTTPSIFFLIFNFFSFFFLPKTFTHPSSYFIFSPSNIFLVLFTKTTMS